jgi:uncharacterized protein
MNHVCGSCKASNFEKISLKRENKQLFNDLEICRAENLANLKEIERLKALLEAANVRLGQLSESIADLTTEATTTIAPAQSKAATDVEAANLELVTTVANSDATAKTAMFKRVLTRAMKKKQAARQEKHQFSRQARMFTRKRSKSPI